MLYRLKCVFYVKIRPYNQVKTKCKGQCYNQRVCIVTKFCANLP